MSRGGMVWGGTPVCIQCGRTKRDREGPWMQHPVDYGWWCGCCLRCSHPEPDPPERYCPNCKAKVYDDE